MEAFGPEPAPPLPADQEQAIRAWLESIGERDADTIEDTMMVCRYDAEARRYYLRRAEGGVS